MTNFLPGGFGGMIPEKILKWLMQSGAFLMHYFDRLSLKSTTICYKKISIIHYTWLHSCYVLFCFLRNFKKHALVDAFLSYFA